MCVCTCAFTFIHHISVSVLFKSVLKRHAHLVCAHVSSKHAVEMHSVPNTLAARAITGLESHRQPHPILFLQTLGQALDLGGLQVGHSWAHWMGEGQFELLACHAKLKTSYARSQRNPSPTVPDRSPTASASSGPLHLVSGRCLAIWYLSERCSGEDIRMVFGACAAAMREQTKKPKKKKKKKRRNTEAFHADLPTHSSVRTTSGREAAPQPWRPAVRHPTGLGPVSSQAAKAHPAQRPQWTASLAAANLTLLCHVFAEWLLGTEDSRLHIMKAAQKAGLRTRPVVPFKILLRIRQNKLLRFVEPLFHPVVRLEDPLRQGSSTPALSRVLCPRPSTISTNPRLVLHHGLPHSPPLQVAAFPFEVAPVIPAAVVNAPLRNAAAVQQLVLHLAMLPAMAMPHGPTPQSRLRVKGIHGWQGVACHLLAG